MGTGASFPFFPPRSPSPALPLFFLLLLAGCFPSSCRQDSTRALLPADSLSREIAAQTLADTLRLLWQTAETTEGPLDYPRTVRFGEDERLYLSDAEAGHILAFTLQGDLIERLEEGRSPFLAGQRGDTLVVFDPEARHLRFLFGGTTVRTVPTPTDLPERGRLQYAVVGDRAIYFKGLADEMEGYLARLDEAGRVRQRVPLPGPSWRHAGLLRLWGDTLVSLSGFRPVVDLLAPEGRLDTLALLGFDSPMLGRSRAFLKGTVGEAPLLTSSADAAGDHLFVINLRAGWLRVDVYDRSGHLQHVLVEENPGYNRQFFPTDLAVRRRADGSYDLAVAVGQPPLLQFYRWPGPSE